MAPTVMLVKLEDVTKRFFRGREEIAVLRNISLEIAAGQFIVVIGQNGVGKSTLLNVMAGRVIPEQGRVLIFQRDQIRLLQSLGRSVSSLVARVWQDPRRGTVADLTVMDNLRLAQLPRLPRRFRSRFGEPERKILRDALGEIGLSSKAGSLVGELSHGQRQLLALEMAIVRKPKILLLDEHTASLDPRNADLVMEVTENLWRQHQITIIMVTHNLSHATRYGDRLIVLRDGSVATDLDADRKMALGSEELFGLAAQ